MHNTKNALSDTSGDPCTFKRLFVIPYNKRSQRCMGLPTICFRRIKVSLSLSLFTPQMGDPTPWNGRVKEKTAKAWEEGVKRPLNTSRPPSGGHRVATRSLERCGIRPKTFFLSPLSRVFDSSGASEREGASL